MPEGTHHHTGQAAHTAFCIDEHNLFIVLLQCPGDAGIYAGCLLAMPTGIDPRCMVHIDQPSPGLGGAFFKSPDNTAPVAVMRGRAVHSAQPAAQAVF